MKRNVRLPSRGAHRRVKAVDAAKRNYERREQYREGMAPTARCVCFDVTVLVTTKKIPGIGFRCPYLKCDLEPAEERAVRLAGGVPKSWIKVPGARRDPSRKLA